MSDSRAVVSKGQFLERPTLIPVREHVLEGLSHRGDAQPPLLIIPPPPGQGGMDHPAAAEIAWAAARRGFATLRFNFRGVGASQGAPGGPEDRLEDGEAALRVLEENAQVVTAAVASLGASASTACALIHLHPGTSGLCLISPSDIPLTDLARVRVPLLAIAAEMDGSLPTAALGAAVAEAGGRLELMPEDDASFRRHLSEVGRAVARWLEELGSDSAKR